MKYFIDNGCKVLALDIGKNPRRMIVSENVEYMQCGISNTAIMLDRILVMLMIPLFILHGQARQASLALTTIFKCGMHLIR